MVTSDADNFLNNFTMATPDKKYFGKRERSPSPPSQNRNALLSQIQKGTGLKKVPDTEKKTSRRWW